MDEFTKALLQLQGISNEAKDSIALRSEVQKLENKLKSIAATLKFCAGGESWQNGLDVQTFEAAHTGVRQKHRQPPRAPSSAGDTVASPCTQAARASETSGSHLSVGSDAKS